MNEFEKWLRKQDIIEAPISLGAEYGWKAALEWVSDEFVLVNSCFDIPEFRETLNKELKE